MRVFIIYCAYAVSLLSVVTAAVTFTEIIEVALSCTSPLSPNCSECDLEGSCSRCKLGYFLYKQPVSFDPDKGILADAYSCVECPGYTAGASDLKIPCGDCVDYPNSWQDFRMCTYEYSVGAMQSTKSPNDVMLRVHLQENQLYYIIGSVASGFTTAICQGCSSFCGNNSDVYGCKPSSTSTTDLDTLQQYFICALGYFYQGKTKTCAPCAANCDKCTGSTECNECSSGYTINNHRNCVQCSLTIPNCQKCYYADDTDRNFSAMPQMFSQITDAQLTPQNIHLRCYSCAVTATNNMPSGSMTSIEIETMLIPSLDLLSCISCGSVGSITNSCKRCDYTQIGGVGEIHTKSPRVIPSAQHGNYQKRCRTCNNNYYLTCLGTCDLRDATHANCKIPMRGIMNSSDVSKQYPTLALKVTANGFESKDFTTCTTAEYASYQPYCALCMDQYKQTVTGSCVPVVPANEIASCRYYQFTTKDTCIACQNQNVFDNLTNQCSSSTSSYNIAEITSCDCYYLSSGQMNCLSCTPSASGTTGQYPNYTSGACEDCTGNCEQCQKWNWMYLLTDSLALLAPEFSQDDQNFYEDVFEVEASTWCDSCPNGNKQDPWTGICYGCSRTTCGQCNFKMTYPQCDTSALSPSLTLRGSPLRKGQTLDKTGTAYCSDYQESCTQISYANKKLANPFNADSSQYYNAAPWTRANMCQTQSVITNSSPTDTVFYNSLIQKCALCSSPNTACKKKLIVVTFLDNALSFSDFWSNYESTMTTKPSSSSQYLFNPEVYSLDEFASLRKSQTINLSQVLGQAITFTSSVYTKYIEESVEEIEFWLVLANTLNGSSLDDISINYSLTFSQEAMAMIPALVRVSAQLTTMVSGDFSTIGTYPVTVYMLSDIRFFSFTEVVVNKINLKHISELDNQYDISVFQLKIANALLPVSVILQNIQISSSVTLADQMQEQSMTGISAYFVLICPNLQSLQLINFQLSSFYYPAGVNFYDPGTTNNAVKFTLNTVVFSNLQFSNINIFMLNNTESSIVFNTVSLTSMTLEKVSFIKESSLISSSLIRIDLLGLTFTNLDLTNSYLVNVMNVVRFIASDWSFLGTFVATSDTIATALFSTNLISINTFTIQSPGCTSFILTKVTLFKTPPYSLYVAESLQINHRYKSIFIQAVICNLSDSKDTIQVTNCLFHLYAPYNPSGYLLNVMINTLTIKSTTTTTSTELETQWYLMNLQDISSITLSSIRFFGNYQFQGMYIYNPSVLAINVFICGDDSSTIFDSIKANYYSGSTLNEQQILGQCLDLKYCQQSLSLSNLSLLNYVGLNDSAFAIECPIEIKNKKYNDSPVTITEFAISNSLIVLQSSENYAAPILFESNFPFTIVMSSITIQESYLYAASSIISMTFPSATGIYVDSITSSITIADSSIGSTSSILTPNSMYLQCASISISNSMFTDGNVGQQGSQMMTHGGQMYLSSPLITMIGINVRNSYADRGGGIFIKALQSAVVSISGNSIFSSCSTGLFSYTNGIGGAIYIDAKSAGLTLTIDSTLFEDNYARIQGGALYIETGIRTASVAITNSVFKNTYAPQGSVLFWTTEAPNNLMSFANCNFIWEDQFTIDNFITTKLTSTTVPENDPQLVSAWEKHSYIYMMQGSLTLDTCDFFGLKYQTLLYLSQIKDFYDNNSVINGYKVFTYPMILFEAQAGTMTFQGTTIKEVMVCDLTICSNAIFTNNFQTAASSIIQHNTQTSSVLYSQVTFVNNVLDSPHGLITFMNPAGTIEFQSGTFSNNINLNGVVNIIKTTSYTRRMLRNEGAQNNQEEEEEEENYYGDYDSDLDETDLFDFSKFSSNNTRQLAGTNWWVKLTGTTFASNSGQYGAAIHTLNSPLNLISCTFTSNVASSSGGALFFTASTADTTSLLTITSSSFTLNQAMIGGAYYHQGVVPVLTGNTITNNVALLYGQNAATYPQSLRLLYNGKIISTSGTEIANYGSGQSSGALVIQLLDSESNVYLPLSTATCTVATNYAVASSKPSTAKISGNLSPTFNSYIKGFNITDLLFIVKPPLSLQIKITCDSIKIPISGSTSYDTSYSFPLSIAMRSCVVGEIFQADSGNCYACPSGKYSLVQGSEACSTCPKVGVENCPGYNYMNITYGYWRKNTSSDIIEYCKNLPANCEGGIKSQTCYEGHIGALCEECDLYGVVWGESYSHSSEYTCALCSTVSGNILKIAGVSLWTLISLVLSVKSAQQLIEMNLCREILIKIGFISAGRSSQPNNQTSVLLKILTSYFQIISIIFTFNLSTPSFFSSVSNTVGNPSKQMSMSMDCFLLDMAGDIPVTYFRLIWLLINPLLYIGVAVIYFVFIFIASHVSKKFKGANKKLSQLLCACIFLFVTLQPSIVSAYIATASCRIIADVAYIKSNVALECYSSEHITYLIKLVIPILLLWVFVIPMAFFLKMYKNRKLLYNQSSLKYSLGYLYMEYQPNAYFWEFVKMFQKIMIIIFINVYDSDVKVKGVLSFMVIVIYLILSYTFRPYSDIILTRLDQLANECCAISVIIGVFLYQNNFSYLVYIGFFLLTVYNAYFLIMLFRNIFKGYAQMIDGIVYAKFDKIVGLFKKFPKIQAFLNKKHMQYVPPKRVKELWCTVNMHIREWMDQRVNNPNAVFGQAQPQLEPVKTTPYPIADKMKEIMSSSGASGLKILNFQSAAGSPSSARSKIVMNFNGAVGSIKNEVVQSSPTIRAQVEDIDSKIYEPKLINSVNSSTVRSPQSRLRAMKIHLKSKLGVKNSEDPTSEKLCKDEEEEEDFNLNHPNNPIEDLSNSATKNNNNRLTCTPPNGDVKERRDSVFSGRHSVHDNLKESSNQFTL